MGSNDLDQTWRPGSGLKLIACLAFAILIWSVFFGSMVVGRTFGDLPQLQHQAVKLTEYTRSLPPQPSQFDIQPGLFEPDYHLLYQPDQFALADAARNGRLPIFDHTRMLGAKLWGNVNLDFANPLNVLYAFLPPAWVFALKTLFHMTLAVTGFVYFSHRILRLGFLGSLVGAGVYLLTPFAVDYLHWVGLHGAMCLAPWALVLTERLAVRRRALDAALLALLLAFAVALNMAQTIIFLGLLVFAYGAVRLLTSAELRTKPALIELATKLTPAALATIVLTLPVTLPELRTVAEIARQPTPFGLGDYPYLELWKPKVLLGLFLPLTTSPFFMYLLYAPGVVLALALYGLAKKSDVATAMRAVQWTALIFLVWFFVGFIDLPLHLLASRVYDAGDGEQLRGIFLLLMLAAIGIARGLSAIETGGSRLLTAGAAALSLGLAAVLALIAFMPELLPQLREAGAEPKRLLIWAQLRSPLFWLSGALALAGFATLVLGRWRPRLGGALTGVLVLGVYLAFATSKVPSYEPRPTAALGTHTGAPQCRSTRLLAFTDFNSQPFLDTQVEVRVYTDAVLWSYGLTPLGGYQTALSKKALSLYDLFIGPKYEAMRRQPFLSEELPGRFGHLARFYILTEAEAVAPGGHISDLTSQRLRLLGVGQIYSEAALTGFGNGGPGAPIATHVNRDNTCALAHFAPVAASRLAELFRLDTTAGVLPEVRPLKVSFDRGTGAYQVPLAGRAGAVVLPFEFPPAFRIRIDGRDIGKVRPTAVQMIDVPAGGKRLEIVPDTRPLLLSIIACLAGGLALLAGLVLWERRSIRSRTT